MFPWWENYYCTGNRIPGAVKVAAIWLSWKNLLIWEKKGEESRHG